ncbi:MAG: hypothetical protein JO199_08680, partial [Candidatus Eremiobacteraeota bacterium]|nr:hypothetical protein [Candidatus Eremiobacteraeota bacterium]
MRSLAFERTGARVGGRTIRRARFERRSMLPVGAACLVAASVRESLASAWGRATVVRLFEPAIPSPSAWEAIASGAAIYRVRGDACDAAIVLRPPDAAALAAAAFGEP